MKVLDAVEGTGTVCWCIFGFVKKNSNMTFLYMAFPFSSFFKILIKWGKNGGGERMPRSFHDQYHHVNQLVNYDTV